MKIKSLLKNPIFYGIVLIAVVALSLYIQKNVLTPQTSPLANLNIPSRYAFVADNESAQLAVVDTYDNKFIQTLALKVPAQLMSMSRVSGVLAYTEKDSNTIYLLDLDDMTENQLTTGAAVKSLIMHGDGFWLSYVTDNEVVMQDIVMNKTKRIPISGNTTLAYSPDGSALFIVEQDLGKISQIPLAEGQQRTFDIGNAISAIAIMPDGQGLVFSAADSVYFLNLLDGNVISKPFNANYQRPYITNDSRTVLLTDAADNSLVLFSPTDLTENKRIALDKAVASEPYTGWLEQVAVLGSNKAIVSTNFADSHSLVKSVDIPGDIVSALVQSDSKTFLATMQDSEDLLFFDLKSRIIKATVELPLTQPGLVLMGQTNTLCH